MVLFVFPPLFFWESSRIRNQNCTNFIKILKKAFFGVKNMKMSLFHEVVQQQGSVFGRYSFILKFYASLKACLASKSAKILIIALKFFAFSKLENLQLFSENTKDCRQQKLVTDPFAQKY